MTVEDLADFMLDTTGYLESLIKSRKHLTGRLLTKLDEVIEAELELALMNVQKSKSEILKDKKDNVKPIK